MTMPKTDDVNTAIPQTREEILRVFSSHMKEMAEFGVEGLMLFGSAATDTLTPQSDVDVVVGIVLRRRTTLSLCQKDT